MSTKSTITNKKKIMPSAISVGPSTATMGTSAYSKRPGFKSKADADSMVSVASEAPSEADDSSSAAGSGPRKGQISPRVLKRCNIRRAYFQGMIVGSFGLFTIFGLIAIIVLGVAISRIEELGAELYKIEHGTNSRQSCPGK